MANYVCKELTSQLTIHSSVGEVWILYVGIGREFFEGLNSLTRANILFLLRWIKAYEQRTLLVINLYFLEIWVPWVRNFSRACSLWIKELETIFEFSMAVRSYCRILWVCERPIITVVGLCMPSTNFEKKIVKFRKSQHTHTHKWPHMYL